MGAYMASSRIRPPILSLRSIMPSQSGHSGGSPTAALPREEPVPSVRDVIERRELLINRRLRLLDLEKIPRYLAAFAIRCRSYVSQNVAASWCLSDPHGDLLTVLLGIIPPERQADVVVLDLADVAYPVGLNPLDVTLGRDPNKAVENLLLIFSHIWTRFGLRAWRYIC